MRGFTLVELIVALTIIGLITGVSGLALGRLNRPQSNERSRLATAAQREAIVGRHSVRLIVSRDTILFLPDGRSVGRGVDPLTGALRDPR